MFWWTFLLVGCAVLALSVDVNGARRCRLLDEAGKPVPNAFVTYHYSAGTKLIWPLAYHDGPFLTRTDNDGRFNIPMKVHLRFPFVTLHSPVRLMIGVYIPRLHSSCTLFDPSPQDSYCAKPLSKGGELSFRMLDLRTRPAARFRTLWLLICGYQTLQAPVAQQQELMAAVRREYDQFLSEYGDIVFDNSHNKWGRIKVDDWTKESGENRPWSFFLQKVPFYGISMEEKLSQMERQIR